MKELKHHINEMRSETSEKMTPSINNPLRMYYLVILYKSTRPPAI